MDVFAIKREADLLNQQGCKKEALDLYDQAIRLRPQYWGAHYEKASILLDFGRFVEAANSFLVSWLHSRYRKEPGLMCARSLALGQLYLDAISIFEKISPTELDPQSLVIYAESLRREGRVRDAEKLIQQCQPMADSMYYQVLGAIEFDMGRVDTAELFLKKALPVDETGFVHLMLLGLYESKHDWLSWVQVAREGEKRFPTNEYFKAAISAHRILHLNESLANQSFIQERNDLPDAALYLREKTDGDLLISGNTLQTFSLIKPFVKKEGVILEFGVRNGHSINFLAEIFPEKRLFGFDSFEGLPEAWHQEGAGSYTTNGKMPEAPENVEFIKGWFENTLPIFAKNNSEPIALINIDCDLYSATKTVFDQLSNRITPGCVIIFDEYIGNPTWRDDEYKAFQEWVGEKKVVYKYLVASLFTKQVAVKIESIGN